MYFLKNTILLVYILFGHCELQFFFCVEYHKYAQLNITGLVKVFSPSSPTFQQGRLIHKIEKPI